MGNTLRNKHVVQNALSAKNDFENYPTF